MDATTTRSAPWWRERELILLVLLAAVVLLLIDAGLEPWLAALLVAVAVLAIGAALVWRGREGLRTTSLTPERTIETLKEDAEWAKEQIR